LAQAGQLTASYPSLARTFVRIQPVVDVTIGLRTDENAYRDSWGGDLDLAQSLAERFSRPIFMFAHAAPEHVCELIEQQACRK
jgi:hypothetical protein